MGLQPWSRRPAHHAHLIELLILFFASFKGRAILEPSFGQVFLDFTQLPKGELIQLAQDLGQKKIAGDLENLRKSLDAKGQKALLAALYTAEWAYYTESDATGWLFASPIGLGMLGLETPPAAPATSDLFKALPNLSVFAGAGLGRDKLVPLFRHCVIKKIDQVFEFKLDQRRLSESPAATLLAEELRKALGDAGPLPSTAASVLAAKTRSSGEIGIRLCRRAGQAGDCGGGRGDPKSSEVKRLS